MMRKSLPYIIKVLIIVFFVFLTLFIRESIIIEYSYLRGDISSGLSTIALIGVFITSLIICLVIKSTTIKSDRTTIVFISFLSLITIISFIYAPFVNVGSRNIYIGLLCYFSSYYAFYKIAVNYTSDGLIKYSVLVLFLVLSYTYFTNYRQLGAYSSIFLSLNSVYVLLFLFPIVSLLLNKKIQIVFATIIIIAIILSNKRGGFLAGGLGIISYYLVDYLFIKGKVNSTRIKQFIVLFVVFIFFYFIINSLLNADNNIMMERVLKLQDDEGSGRLEIWKEVWQGIKNSSEFDLLAGHGIESVRLVTFDHDSAHNEYLEVLYDFGAISLIIFVLLILRLFSFSRRLLKNNSIIAAPLFSLSVLIAAMSLISHTLIYPRIMIIISLTLGFFIGKSKIIYQNENRNYYLSSSD